MRKKKMFAAEIQQLRLQTGDDAVAAETTVPLNGDIGNAEILAAILSLKKSILASAPSDGSAPEADALPAPEVPSDEDNEGGVKEVSLLRNELQALSRAIEDTKSEIVSLRPVGSDDDHLNIVANELDEVVAETERATELILDTAEVIDGLAQSIRNSAVEELEKEQADEIMERVLKIYEACNFQDLTGQRITKIVKTLNFVESRIDSMIEIWGKENLDRTKTTPAAVAAKEDGHLLNGPQLEGKGISQDEIDNLFD